MRIRQRHCIHDWMFMKLALSGLVLGSIPLGCGGGVEVTAESLAAARAAWARAGVRDYEVEWTSTGPSRSHYVVQVRDGQVDKVEGVAPGGNLYPLKPAATRFYSVDGLFLVIADELAQLKSPTPFGQPAGSRAVLLLSTDPKYGYPRRYQRDVVGAPVSLSIDVVRFTPGAPARAGGGVVE